MHCINRNLVIYKEEKKPKEIASINLFLTGRLWRLS